MWYARGRETSRKWFSFGGEFNGKEIRENRFLQQELRRQRYCLECFIIRLVRKKWSKMKIQKPIALRWLRSLLQSMSWSKLQLKRASGERCPLPRAKSDRCSDGCQGRAGQELEEKKAEVTEAENLIATTSNAQVQNAENDVKVAQAYVTIEENKVREAESAHDQVVEAVRQQENQVTAQESLVDVAQNELNQAKAPISNDENVLNQALLEQSQVEQSIRESQNSSGDLASESAKWIRYSGSNWERYSIGSNASDRFESCHRNQGSRIGSLRTSSGQQPSSTEPSNLWRLLATLGWQW